MILRMVSVHSQELLSKPLFVYDKEDVCGQGHGSEDDDDGAISDGEILY